MSPAEGQRPASARGRASLTRSSGMVSRRFQPTALREYQSNQTAKYSQPPLWWGTQVMSPTQVWGGGGRAYREVVVNGAGHKRAGLPGPQAVRVAHAADAPAVHGVAVGLPFRAQPAVITGGAATHSRKLGPNAAPGSSDAPTLEWPVW